MSIFYKLVMEASSVMKKLKMSLIPSFSHARRRGVPTVQPIQIVENGYRLNWLTHV
jgi:hypothetical protein